MKTIIFLISVSFFSSCCYKVDCNKSSLKFALVSFSPSEMDTLIFRKFDTGTNFQTPKDIMQINDISVFNPYSQGDTVNFETYNSTNFKFEIQPGYDYEILIPGTNRLVKISDIVENQTQRKKCDISDGNQSCYNPIVSYKIDGVAETTDYFVIIR